MTFLLFSLGGFLLGSILFSKIIPQLVAQKNVCELSDDQNPGAANVFMKCGIRLGFLCLFLDILKGFIPVFLATFFVDTGSMWFSFVIMSPALGHALGIFNRFRGGKCISTSFGIVLGLMPVSRIGFLLAIIYILFSTVVAIKPNSLRSIISFGLFAVGETVILCIVGKYSIALGCALFSVIAIIKHVFAPSASKNAKREDDFCERNA